jgi:thymidylate synthase ThyX
MYSTRILKDTLAPCGKRLTTWELTYPRFVHAELMTHRLFSRNAASSRAIPIEKLIERVEQDPAMPVFWGKNQKGMQAEVEMSPLERAAAETSWLHARDLAVQQCRALADLGVHKQLANRIIEPWMFITVIVSATEYSNWFHLRDHPMAQPEISWVAKDMWTKYNEEKPTACEAGAWHLPLIGWEDVRDAIEQGLAPEDGSGSEIATVMKKVSTGRCARVSYLTHEGKRDLAEDIKLHDRLCAGPATGNPGHWSPFEHVAMALAEPTRSGNFVGFAQYRKEFSSEHFGEPMP